MKFIEFCGEIINTNCIETIWTRTVSPDYTSPFEVCIGEFKERDMMNDPYKVVLNEGYKTQKEQEKRYNQLKKLLCNQDL